MARQRTCGLLDADECCRGAVPVGDTREPLGGNRIMDLLGGFVGLVAFIAFLACLGKVCHTLSALEKRERGH